MNGFFTGSELFFGMDIEEVSIEERVEGNLRELKHFRTADLAVVCPGQTGTLLFLDDRRMEGIVQLVEPKKGEKAKKTVPLPLLVPPKPPRVPKQVILPPDGWSEGAPGQFYGPIGVESEHSVPEGFASRVQSLVRTRGDEYGSPAENHQLTAELWSAWLSRRVGSLVKLSAEDVCHLNILQKESRLAFQSKDDSVFDVAGYAENIAMCRKDQRNYSRREHLELGDNQS